MGSLIQELESKAQVLNTEEFFLTKIKLQGAAEMFRVSLLMHIDDISLINYTESDFHFIATV